ncbi:MAG: hypothetical protein P1U40_00920 [Coxiellaceae bacterium]|nr:hypothetical protein [Coxiellaceae bacterium]
MSRSKKKAIILQACDEALYALESQERGLFDKLFSSNSDRKLAADFRDSLLSAYDPIPLCAQRIKNFDSVWNSTSRDSRKSFNSYFLVALEGKSATLYREVIAEAFRLEFHNEYGVTLYRGDKRDPKTIFPNGFKPFVAMSAMLNRNPKYSSQYTGSNGVSTSKLFSYAGLYSHNVYTIKFNGRTVEHDSRLLAINLVRTGERRKLGRVNIGYQKAEINFLSGIPPFFIQSCTRAGTVSNNPHFTGSFPTPSPHVDRFLLREMPVESKSSVEESKAEDDWVMIEHSALPAVTAGRYSAGDKVTLVSYRCDIQLYRGSKGQVHIVFNASEQASAFIAGENLMSDRNPGRLKRPDPRRYVGLFAVRTSQANFKALRAKFPTIPKVSDLPSAPIYK